MNYNVCTKKVVRVFSGKTGELGINPGIRLSFYLVFEVRICVTSD